MEENEQQNSKEEVGGEPTPDLGKFKSVDALLRAYSQLEAEFTRRSQKLKALEDAASQTEEAAGAVREEDLYRMVNENEGVRARVLGDYLASLKGVPLLTNSGVGITAETSAPKTFAEAGIHALGYLKNNKN